jgi:hypothetical protein
VVPIAQGVKAEAVLDKGKRIYDLLGKHIAEGREGQERRKQLKLDLVACEKVVKTHVDAIGEWQPAWQLGRSLQDVSCT